MQGILPGERQARHTYLTQRSYGVSREVRADHSHVPATNTLTPLVPLGRCFLFSWSLHVSPQNHVLHRRAAAPLPLSAISERLQHLC